MKISIVTPSYNSGPYIEETIRSIADQSYKDTEHIVMDGASKDNTVEILKKYPHLKWVSEKDKGQSDAINKGFRLTTGDVLAWQNADDYYLPGTFEIVAETFRKNPDVDIVYGGYQVIDSKGKWLFDTHSRDWSPWLFSHGRFVPGQPTVFWRRRVYDKLGDVNPDLHFCMDVDFYSRAAKHFRFLRIPKLLGVFRSHQESKTQSGLNQRKIHAEFRSVLAKNFGYGPLDYLVFEGFYYRSRLAGRLKSKILKKW